MLRVEHDRAGGRVDIGAYGQALRGDVHAAALRRAQRLAHRGRLIAEDFQIGDLVLAQQRGIEAQGADETGRKRVAELEPRRQNIAALQFDHLVQLVIDATKGISHGIHAHRQAGAVRHDPQVALHFAHRDAAQDVALHHRRAQRDYLQRARVFAFGIAGVVIEALSQVDHFLHVPAPEILHVAGDDAVVAHIGARIGDVGHHAAGHDQGGGHAGRGIVEAAAGQVDDRAGFDDGFALGAQAHGAALGGALGYGALQARLVGLQAVLGNEGGLAGIGIGQSAVDIDEDLLAAQRPVAIDRGILQLVSAQLHFHAVARGGNRHIFQSGHADARAAGDVDAGSLGDGRTNGLHHRIRAQGTLVK